MELKTKRFGVIEVRDEDRLSIPGGLLGLDGLEEWVFHRAKGFGLFQWLQSLDVPRVALIVAPARSIRAGYRAEVTEDDLRALEMGEGDELDCLVVLREPRDSAKMTANLLGPIMVNRRSRRAVQVVQHDSGYSAAENVLAGATPATEAA